jgi:epsin
MFLEIMDMVDKRLNDSGKNWRHVFKVAPFSGVDF